MGTLTTKYACWHACLLLKSNSCCRRRYRCISADDTSCWCHRYDWKYVHGDLKADSVHYYTEEESGSSPLRSSTLSTFSQWVWHHVKAIWNWQSDRSHEVCSTAKVNLHLHVSILLEKWHRKGRRGRTTCDIWVYGINKPQLCTCGEVPDEGDDLCRICASREASADEWCCCLP